MQTKMVLDEKREKTKLHLVSRGSENEVCGQDVAEGMLKSGKGCKSLKWEPMPNCNQTMEQRQSCCHGVKGYQASITDHYY